MSQGVLASGSERMIKPNDIKTQRDILSEMEYCNECLDNIEGICNGTHTTQVSFIDSFNRQVVQIVKPYYNTTNEKILGLIKEDLGTELHELNNRLKEVRKYESVDIDNKNNILIPQAPQFEADGYDTEGNLIYDTWICPNCKTHYEVEYDHYKYCPECGQAIDWSAKKPLVNRFR